MTSFSSMRHSLNPILSNASKGPHLQSGPEKVRTHSILRVLGILSHILCTLPMGEINVFISLNTVTELSKSDKVSNNMLNVSTVSCKHESHEGFYDYAACRPHSISSFLLPVRWLQMAVQTSDVCYTFSVRDFINNSAFKQSKDIHQILTCNQKLIL